MVMVSFYEIQCIIYQGLVSLSERYSTEFFKFSETLEYAKHSVTVIITSVLLIKAIGVCHKPSYFSNLTTEESK